MAWGTGKGGSSGGGKHGGNKDFSKDKPSKDGQRPTPEPKHKDGDKK
ncbi:hypothetical protein [Kitasatospora aureofaciens]|nr:hypothetical protein [Kitasatospora aureofaciens]MBV6699285.1 hypothetical protein [Kitasatospora aureofaciens]